MLNSVILMGRNVKDGELFNAGTDKAVYRNRIAVERPFAKEGEQSADFVDFVAFRKTADWADKYIGKGSKIIIQGSLAMDQYTDKNGKPQTHPVINVKSIDFAESKAASEKAAPAKEKAAPAKAAAPAAAPAPAKENAPAPQAAPDGFMTIPEGIAEELPFA